MKEAYPEYLTHLRGLASRLRRELPGPMSAFAQLHHAATAEGNLSPKVKELIALGIAISARCGGCLTYHVRGALDSGATRQEILEAIGVAILMGGGPAAVYGSEALEALEEFEAAGSQ
jgi:AhpD family alkylhydroperoxidase